MRTVPSMTSAVTPISSSGVAPMTQRVRDQLGQQQLHVLEHADREPLGEPAGHLGARGRRRCGDGRKGHRDASIIWCTTRSPPYQPGEGQLPTCSSRLARVGSGFDPARASVGRRHGRAPHPTRLRGLLRLDRARRAAPDGERLGAVELIFLDEATDLPEWVLVRLEDADGRAFVPLAGATVEERSIRVEQDRERSRPRRTSRWATRSPSPRSAASTSTTAWPTPRRSPPPCCPRAPGHDAAGREPSEEPPAPAQVRRRPSPRRPRGRPAEARSPADHAAGAHRLRPPPRAIPPEGGFQAQQERELRAACSRCSSSAPALPVALAGGDRGPDRPARVAPPA